MVLHDNHLLVIVVHYRQIYKYTRWCYHKNKVSTSVGDSAYDSRSLGPRAWRMRGLVVKCPTTDPKSYLSFTTDTMGLSTGRIVTQDAIIESDLGKL